MGDNDRLPAGTEFRLQQFFEVLEHAGNINNIFQTGLEKTFNMHDRMSKGDLAGVPTSTVGDLNKKPWFEVVDGDNLSKIIATNPDAEQVFEYEKDTVFWVYPDGKEITFGGEGPAEIMAIAQGG